MQPIPKLNQSDDEGSNADDDRSQKRNDSQNNRRCPNKQSIRKSDQEEPQAIKNAIGNRYQHLATEKGNEITIDGVENEDQLILKCGIRDGQIISPARTDATFLQQEI